MNKKRSTAELNRPDVETFKSNPKIPVKIVLEDIRSLANVGSIFRSADAFNVEEICLCGITGTPPHRDIHKTALGATESVRWSYHKSAVDLLSQLKVQTPLTSIVAVEQCEGALQLQHWFNPVRNELRYSNFVIVLGNEVEGVSDEVIKISTQVIEIPQSGTKHSLNVTVAAGLVLWELYKHLELSKRES